MGEIDKQVIPDDVAIDILKETLYNKGVQSFVINTYTGLIETIDDLDQIRIEIFEKGKIIHQTARDYFELDELRSLVKATSLAKDLLDL